MTKRLVTVFIALMLVVAACGGTDSESSDTTTKTPGAAAPASDLSGGEDAGSDADSEEPAKTDAPSGGSKATLTLDNGEVFEFGILCALEPQESAGQEILFTVVSYDKPYNLDVTQFGENSFGGAANISLYDAETYDTVWEASTMIGTAVTLALSGSTVTGSGTFLADGEPGGDEVHGELEADC